jgi:hypothetical protein
MGDWRRVKIEGTCGAHDVPKLREMLDPGDDYENFHCLVYTAGVCGLPDWAGEQISAVGNLAERNYDAESVREVLLDILGMCPSLSVRVHVGDHNESAECVATVVACEGLVTVGDAAIDTIPELDRQQMGANLMSQLRRAQG